MARRKTGAHTGAFSPGSVMKKLLLLVPILLVAGAAGHVAYDRSKNMGAAADASLQALGGGDLAAAFTPKSDPQALLGDVRREEGNAGVELAALLIRDSKDPVTGLAHLEAAGARRTCNLVPAVWPIPSNPAQLSMPNPTAMKDVLDQAAEKAKALEAAGDAAGAEREWRLLLSAGHHLEQELTLPLAVMGLVWQQKAAEGLKEHHATRGAAGEAAAADAYAGEIARLRKSIASVNHLGGLALREDGRALLRRLAEAPGVLRSAKAEAALSNATQHLYFTSGRLYGPSRGQRDLHGVFEASGDPGLQDWARKNRYYLDMGLAQRVRSVEKVAILN